MNDKERIEILELRIKLLETQLELVNLINTQTDCLQPRYAEPIYPWYPTYPWYMYVPLTTATDTTTS